MSLRNQDLNRRLVSVLRNCELADLQSALHPRRILNRAEFE